jgi:hypothetical protein
MVAYPNFNLSGMLRAAKTHEVFAAMATAQPRTQGLSSCGKKTLVDAGHVI